MKAVIIKPYSSVPWMPPSHSLYGILFSAMSLLLDCSDFENILSYFVQGKPPFLISSSFPFVTENNKKIYFLPFPQNYLLYLDKVNEELSLNKYRDYKRFKKIKFVPSEIFFKLINCEITVEEYFDSRKWEDYESYKFFEQIDILHNSINRMNNTVAEGLLYNTNELFFKDGFYFLIKGDDSLIHGALNYLSDFGIGGNNSIGKGQFSWSIIDVDFVDDNTSGDHCVTLSSYLPTKDELDIYKTSENFYYNLQQVRGTLGTHFVGNKRVWKKKIITFLPGSVFPAIDKNVIGNMVQVKDLSEGLPHPIYFVGYSFNFMIKLQGV